MPGTIVIRTGERRLYYFVGAGEAIRYPVGVGRAGMQWSGTASINGKYVEPAWSAPASIRRDYRSLPSVVPGGSSHNPMGAAANMASTVPMRRARSVDSCRTAASACITKTLWTSTAASASARAWWLRGDRPTPEFPCRPNAR